MFIDKPLCHKQAPSERHVVLCFICRSDGAKVLYITFFYKHFTPTGLFFKKLKCYIVSYKIAQYLWKRTYEISNHPRSGWFSSEIMDLGEYREPQTGLPIPLGGIAIKRNIPAEIAQKVNRIVRKSVGYALAHPAASREFVRCHAQEMDEIGKQAVTTFFAWARRNKLINDTHENIFLRSAE
ncbi:MAG: hypothetical protein F9K48_02480 [Candidatus Brocadia sp.]|nr:MAG: hypothetical protein F9K48_02480 [Candidatus Brocadia sp.]